MINAVRAEVNGRDVTVTLETDAGDFEVKLRAGNSGSGGPAFVAASVEGLTIEWIKRGPNWKAGLVEGPDGLSWPPDEGDAK